MRVKQHCILCTFETLKFAMHEFDELASFRNKMQIKSTFVLYIQSKIGEVELNSTRRL